MTTILWNGKHLGSDSRKTVLDAATRVPVSYEDGKVCKISAGNWLQYNGKSVEAWGVAGNFDLLGLFKEISLRDVNGIDLAHAEEIWNELCSVICMSSQILMVVEDRIVIAVFKPTDAGMVEWELKEGSREDWYAIGSGANVLQKQIEVMGAAEVEELHRDIKTSDIFKSMAVFSILDAFTGGPTHYWDGECIRREERLASKGGLLREIIDFCTDELRKRFDMTQFMYLISVHFFENPMPEKNRLEVIKQLLLDQYELI